MSTIGKHWPRSAPRWDHTSRCDYCGVAFRRSQLVRLPNGLLAGRGPGTCNDGKGLDEVTLDRLNAAGARNTAFQRAARRGAMMGVTGSFDSETGTESWAVTLTSPNGGSTYYTGEQIEISWTAVGSYSAWKIEFSRDNGDTWTTFVEGLDGWRRSRMWTVDGATTTEFLVRVTGTGGAAYSDTSNSASTVIESVWDTIAGCQGFVLGSERVDNGSGKVETIPDKLGGAFTQSTGSYFFDALVDSFGFTSSAAPKSLRKTASDGSYFGGTDFVTMALRVKVYSAISRSVIGLSDEGPAAPRITLSLGSGSISVSRHDGSAGSTYTFSDTYGLDDGDWHTVVVKSQHNRAFAVLDGVSLGSASGTSRTVTLTDHLMSFGSVLDSDNTQCSIAAGGFWSGSVSSADDLKIHTALAARYP